MSGEEKPEKAEEEKMAEPTFDAEAFEAAVGTSPMDEDAVQMHELFLSLMKAGFLEHQALKLVAFLIDQANQDQIVFQSMMDLDDDDDEDEDDS
jgi:hypothetical protein